MVPTREESIRAAAILLAALIAVFAIKLGPGRVLVPLDTLNSVSPWSAWFKEQAQNRAVGDASTHHFEWVSDFHRRVRSGDLPNWQPNILAGVPYTPNGSVAIHYPPSWIYAIVSPEAGFTLFIVLHLWIAGFGMWLLIRSLGYSAQGAFFAGGAYSMSGLVRDWSFGPLNLPPLVLAPLLLYALEITIQKPTRRRTALVALVVGLILVGGNPQFAYHVFFAAAIFGAARLMSRIRKSLAGLAISATCLLIAIGLGLGLSAAEVIPSLELSKTIARAEEPSEGLRQSTVRPAQLVRLAMPNFYANPMRDESWAGNAELWMDSPYIGLLAAAFALVAVLSLRDSRILAFVAVVVFGAAAVFLPILQVWGHENIPYWSRFRGPARWMSIFNLATCALSGAGFSYLQTRVSSPRARLIGMAGLASIVVLPLVTVVIGRPDIPSGYLGPELVSFAILLLCSLGGVLLISRGRPAMALGVLGVEAIVYFLPFFPSIPNEQVAAYRNVPEVRAVRRVDFTRLARVEPYPGTTPIFTHNFLMLMGKEDAMGLTVFMPAKYTEYMNLLEDHGGFARQTNEIAQFQNPQSLNSPLARLAGIDLAAVDPSSDPPNGWTLAFDGVLDLYKRPGVHPRVWLVSEVKAVAEGEIPNALRDPTLDPFQQAIVSSEIDESRSDVRQTISGEGEVRKHRRDEDSDHVTVDVSSYSVLVVDREFHPGWSAFVDGRRIAPIPVDLAFVGVPMEPGEHRVRLVFEWEAVKRGRLVSLVAMLVIAALAAPIPWRRPRTRTETTPLA